jgi:uncharacterized metal-binding protein
MLGRTSNEEDRIIEQIGDIVSNHSLISKWRTIMKKEDIGIKVPLLFACSGGSEVSHLTYRIARKLAKDQHVYMSCPPPVTAGIKDFLEKLKRDKRVIVLDGCKRSCVAKSLENTGFKGFLHIRLTEDAVCPDKIKGKRKKLDDAYKQIVELIKDEKTWERNVFTYDDKQNKFK